MSSFKEKLSKSGQSVLDARAQNLYELTKIEEDRFVQDCKLKVLRIQGEINKHNDLAVKSRDSSRTMLLMHVIQQLHII